MIHASKWRMVDYFKIRKMTFLWITLVIFFLEIFDGIKEKVPFSMRWFFWAQKNKCLNRLIRKYSQFYDFFFFFFFFFFILTYDFINGWGKDSIDFQPTRENKTSHLISALLKHPNLVQTMLLTWANTSRVPVKRYKLAFAYIEDSDQPAHPRSLIRVFDVRCMGSQWSNVSSDRKLRLWSDCADAQTDLNLLCTHMPTCTLNWLPAHIEERLMKLSISVISKTRN